MSDRFAQRGKGISQSVSHCHGGAGFSNAYVTRYTVKSGETPTPYLTNQKVNRGTEQQIRLQTSFLSLTLFLFLFTPCFRYLQYSIIIIRFYVTVLLQVLLCSLLVKFAGTVLRTISSAQALPLAYGRERD